MNLPNNSQGETVLAPSIENIRKFKQVVVPTTTRLAVFDPEQDTKKNTLILTTSLSRKDDEENSVENVKKVQQQLERNLSFLKLQHADMLRALQNEVEILKRKNRDLQFQLVMQQHDHDDPQEHRAEVGQGRPDELPVDLQKTHRLEVTHSVENEEALEERVKELEAELMEARSRNLVLTQLVEKQKRKLEELDNNHHVNSTVSTVVSTPIRQGEQKQLSTKPNITQEAFKAQVSPTRFESTAIDSRFESPAKNIEGERRLQEAEMIIRQLRRENLQQKKELLEMKSTVDRRNVKLKYKGCNHPTSKIARDDLASHDRLNDLINNDPSIANDLLNRNISHDNRRMVNHDDQDRMFRNDRLNQLIMQDRMIDRHDQHRVINDRPRQHNNNNNLNPLVSSQALSSSISSLNSIRGVSRSSSSRRSLSQSRRTGSLDRFPPLRFGEEQQPIPRRRKSHLNQYGLPPVPGSSGSDSSSSIITNLKLSQKHQHPINLVTINTSQNLQANNGREISQISRNMNTRPAFVNVGNAASKTKRSFGQHFGERR